MAAFAATSSMSAALAKGSVSVRRSSFAGQTAPLSGRRALVAEGRGSLQVRLANHLTPSSSILMSA